MSPKKSSASKPETLRQRFGFMDEDNKTQKHDEIMLWLDKGVQNIIDSLFNKNWSQETRTWGQSQVDYYNDRHRDSREMPPFPPRNFPVLKKDWEYVLKNKSKDPIGFIDMVVEIHYPHLTLNERDWRWDLIDNSIRVCFEVKSAISSLGELIRQVRMYQSYFDTTYIVVSPDDRFAGTLKEQGIQFIKYPY